MPMRFAAEAAKGRWKRTRGKWLAFTSVARSLGGGVDVAVCDGTSDVKRGGYSRHVCG